MTKTCLMCNKELNTNLFGKNRRKKDGLHYWCKNCVKFYVAVNKKKYDESFRKYRSLHREELNEKQRLYNVIHKKEMNKKSRQYNKNHRKDLNKYRQEKYRKDINYKIACCLRSRLQDALKGIGKTSNTLGLLGCMIDQLKEHLEKQFQPGMAWENYGEWHIDHIKPCASFNLIVEEEQRKCFHYSNLQPLWAKDNLEKRNK